MHWAVRRNDDRSVYWFASVSYDWFLLPATTMPPSLDGNIERTWKTDVRRVLCPRRAPFVLVADQPRERYELQTFYYGQIDGRSIRCIADRSFIDWPMPRGTSPRLHLRPHEMKHVQSARRMHAINWCRTTDGQTSIILIGRKGPRPVPEILPVDKGAHKRGWGQGKCKTGNRRTKRQGWEMTGPDEKQSCLDGFSPGPVIYTALPFGRRLQSCVFRRPDCRRANRIQYAAVWRETELRLAVAK